MFPLYYNFLAVLITITPLTFTIILCILHSLEFLTHHQSVRTVLNEGILGFIKFTAPLC